MKRLLALLAVLLAGAVAAPSWSAPTKIGGPTGVLMRDYTIQFDATTDDSPAFETVGSCTFKFTQVGSGSVTVYAVATRSAASGTGTAIATLSADGQRSSVTPPTRWARAVASGTGLDGSILHVECPALSASAGGNVDANNDGLYEFAYADQDWDGDGTGWKTCDCGGTTTPGFTAGYICGTYRTSATDDTPVDYSSDDGANNPPQCRFHGERIWDDVTDDFAALDKLLATGATVYAPPGIYVMHGADASGDCWDSASGTFADTCQSDGATTASSVLIRHSGMTFDGPGNDGNGETDLVRAGAWFVKDKGLRAAWNAATGGTIIPGGICVGVSRANSPGACGLGHASGGADILLNVELGACADSDGDGTCDNGSTRTNIDVDTANVLCVDDAGGFATGMSVGEFYAITMPTLSGGLNRQLMRVDSIGGACGGTSAGLSISFGDVQLFDDLAYASRPSFVQYQVFGAESSDPTEAANNAYITGPVDMARMLDGIRVRGITVAHQDYPGSGTCVDGTQAACDNGPLITLGSGTNLVLDGISVVHSNSTWGSGGVINVEPYVYGAKLLHSTLRHNVGSSLADISNDFTLDGVVVTDNTSVSLATLPSGTTARTHLFRTQGMNWAIRNSFFARNHLPLNYASSIIEAATPYGVIEGNTFEGESSTCINIRPGARGVAVRSNRFNCGAFVNTGTNDVLGWAVRIDASTDAPAEAVDISNNFFIGGGRFTGAADTGEAIGNAHIQIKVSANSTAGEIGPLGISIRDNFAQLKTAADSSLVILRGCDDPDNARIFVDGNRLTTGRIAMCQALPSGGAKYLLDTGANGGTSDDGIGLVTCGANEIAGTWYTSRIAGEGGRSNPSECAAAW